MLISVGALIVSYIFPLAVYFYLKSAHKDDPGYRKDCRKLLLRGLLLGFPVFGFSLLCNILFAITHISDKYPFLKIVFKAFVLAAFSEELMKYLLAKKVIRKNLASVSFLDVMAYTTISAIGFELMEAVFYMFSTNVPQILVRGITNMHAAFGLIMGFILAKGYKKNGKAAVVPAVFVTALIHGLYDLCLDESLVETFCGFIALLLAVFCLVLNIRNFFFMRKARKDPYYTAPLFAENETA
jgi:RsiW-degrading membrane proteinase PrsW (M82 family)